MLQLGRKSLEMAVYVQKYNSGCCFVLVGTVVSYQRTKKSSRLGEKRKKLENSVVRSFVLCTVRQLSLFYLIKEYTRSRGIAVLNLDLDTR